MKHSAAKRKEELSRLYNQSPSTPTKFKIRASRGPIQNKVPTHEIKPLTPEKLIKSFVLTFFIIFIQLLVSSILK